MQDMRQALGSVAAKAAAIAEHVNTITPAERIARGVAAYGWSPDCRCDRCGDTGTLPLSGEHCQCAAGDQRRIADHEARLTAEWERRWAAAGVPKRFRHYRLDTSPLNTPSDRHHVDQVRAWLASDPITTGANLLLFGGIGVGKTGLAVGALRELHTSGAGRLLYIGTSALIDALKPGGDDGILTTCQRADVLALDDLGTTRGTDWERDRLYALINARYEAQLATIVTTNVLLTELAESIGERIASRLLEGATVVGIGGSDRRR